jgi:hypothetical protein
LVGISAALLVITILLSACRAPQADQPGPRSGGRPGSPIETPSPTLTGTPGGDIAFVLQDTYRASEKVDVRITNQGNRAYEYNSTGYEACNLTYRDQSGREFIIPPGTHCDLIAIERIKPGETVTLFECSSTSASRTAGVA